MSIRHGFTTRNDGTETFLADWEGADEGAVPRAYRHCSSRKASPRTRREIDRRRARRRSKRNRYDW